MPVVRDGVMEGDSVTFNVPYIRTLLRYQKRVAQLNFMPVQKKKQSLYAGDKDAFVRSFWEF